MTTLWRCGNVLLLILFVDLYSRLPWCQYCHKQCFLILTRFATFLLRVRITSYIITQQEGVDSSRAAWRSRSLRMEWSGLFCGRKDCKQLGSGYYSDVHGCSKNQIIYVTSRCRFQLGWAFYFFICFISLFDGVMESHCCLCKCYNAYVFIETPIFYFISNP